MCDYYLVCIHVCVGLGNVGGSSLLYMCGIIGNLPIRTRQITKKKGLLPLNGITLPLVLVQFVVYVYVMG